MKLDFNDNPLRSFASSVVKNDILPLPPLLLIFNHRGRKGTQGVSQSILISAYSWGLIFFEDFGP